MTISEEEKREKAKAYCNNKDVFIRSMAGTPHIQLVDTTLSAGSNQEAEISFCIQNHAGVEMWQVAHDDPVVEEEEYDEDAFLGRMKEIAAEIRAQAPQTLYVEFDVNPWSSPPQEKILETFRSNGYKPSPGHDSTIVAGDVASLIDSLGKTVNSPRKLSSVVRMSQAQHGRDFGMIFAEAYNLPPLWGQQSIDATEVWGTRDQDSDKYLHFVGYYNSNEAAVCVTLCLAAGIVGIHVAGTRPRFQKKGLFQEMLYTVLAEHLPHYTNSTVHTDYAASARSTSAAFFQKHGAVPVATKFKYLIA